MTLTKNEIFLNLKKIINRESKTLEEINSLSRELEKIKNLEEIKIINNQINSLKNSLRETNLHFVGELNKIFLPQSLKQKSKISSELPKKKIEKTSPKIVSKIPEEIKPLKIKLSSLEKDTLKRLKKKEEKIVEEKLRKPSKYIQTSNRFFSNFSTPLIHHKAFKILKQDLVKANLQFLPKSYISTIFFTTLLSCAVAFFVFLFFLFFNIGAELPIITLVEEGLATRFLKVFWILFVIPPLTFIMMYTYPSLEAKSAGGRIDQELPFVAINMSAIAGSMVDLNKIFSIILITKEYPYVGREFTKLLNEVNLLGYDLVTALQHGAENSPSKKLAELFNGLATTINSGGNLTEFFSKRAESLLFEYRIEREKRTRSAETFMDIYISVVIAAPMILMLLLMMMKISGLGIQLSTAMITLIMVMGVAAINVGFLTFLHLKQPAGGG